MCIMRSYGAMSIVLLLVSSCSESAGSAVDDGNGNGAAIGVDTVVSGLSNPAFVTALPGDSRLFIVELPGRIRILRDGVLLSQPFLDIRGIVSSGGERGLFSVAFHPEYQQNGFFFVSYTDLSGASRIARYRVSAHPDLADGASEKAIVSVAQPYANHNGGQIAFGPDGMLYIGLGDGGSGGDPLGHGQNRATLLGSLLRVDVDSDDPYGIPPDNPFVNDPDARPEIWAYGLRNPWRFSFDRETGHLHVADVGQNAWEEVNVVPADSAGINFGWNRMEGRHCYASATCNVNGLELPVYEYANSGDTCSVTGGYVYRGSAIPEVIGTYFFADYCEGRLRSFRVQNGESMDARTWDLGRLGSITSFGEDSAGELYIVTAEGVLFRLNGTRPG